MNVKTTFCFLIVLTLSRRLKQAGKTSLFKWHSKNMILLFGIVECGTFQSDWEKKTASLIVIEKTFSRDIHLPSCLICTQKGIYVSNCGLCIKTNSIFTLFNPVRQMVKSVGLFFSFETISGSPGNEVWPLSGCFLCLRCACLLKKEYIVKINVIICKLFCLPSWK